MMSDICSCSDPDGDACPACTSSADHLLSDFLSHNSRVVFQPNKRLRFIMISYVCLTKRQPCSEQKLGQTNQCTRRPSGNSCGIFQNSISASLERKHRNETERKGGWNMVTSRSLCLGKDPAVDSKDCKVDDERTGFHHLSRAVAV